MRIPNVSIHQTYRRFPSPLLPSVFCVLASVSMVPRPASAFGQLSTKFASASLMALTAVVNDPPPASDPSTGVADPSGDAISLYQKGIKGYATGDYSAAIDALTKFIVAAAPGKLRDANLYLGDAYTATKDYEHAVSAYSMFISEHTEDESHAALGRRALAYLMLNKNAEASADFRTYLTFQPSDKTAWNNYIVALTGTEKTPVTDMIDALRGAVSNDPDNLPLRSTLARKLIETKDYVGAITQYDAILTAKPDDFRILFSRGVAYGLEKNAAKAAVDFDAYTKLRPGDASGWNNLGVSLGQQKDYKGSIAAFTQYIALMPSDPDFIVAYKNRGIDYYNIEDWKDADSDLRRYYTAKPDDPDVPKLLAQVVGRTGGDAVIPLEEVVSHTPGSDDAVSWFNLGVAYLDKSDYVKAAGAFTRSNALKADPETLYNLGLVHYSIGEAGDSTAYTKAERDAAAALAMKPNYPDALLVRADAAYAQKKTLLAAAGYGDFVAQPGISEREKTYAQKRLLHLKIESKDFVGVITTSTALIQWNPAEAQNYFIRGTAYIATKKFASAIPDLVQYTSLQADDSMGWYNLGIAYAGKKDTANAAVSYEKASAVRPEDYDAAEQAGTAYRALADMYQAHSAKSAETYENAIRMFDRAARISSDTRKQQSDALYNEAAALEAKARLAGEPDSLKRAIDVWRHWLRLASSDPKAATIRSRVIYLQKHIGRGN